MKLILKVSDRVTVEVESDDFMEAFEKASEAMLLRQYGSCGLCGEEAVMNVKHIEDYKFFCMTCSSRKCRAEFRFGQTKDGRLYPQLKDKEGNWKPDGGWIIWKPAQRAIPSQGNGKDKQQYDESGENIPW